jgi:hypothetical protein
MRLVSCVAAVSVLAVSVPALAEEWIEYADRAERFMVNLPGKPTVRETMYEPQRGPMLPGRLYTVLDGPRRYTVTVINYAKAGVNDVPHAVAWEAWNYRKRGGEITLDSFANVDRISGHHLHIKHADKTVSYVGIFLHARRLYVLEARVPPNSPGALLFLQSLYILDEQGKRIRYAIDADGNRTTRLPNVEGAY